MIKRRENDNEPDLDYWYDSISMDIVSSTECTGMISTPPLTDGEVDGYTGIFDVPQQRSMTAQKADNPAEQERNSR